MASRDEDGRNELPAMPAGWQASGVRGCTPKANGGESAIGARNRGRSGSAPPLGSLPPFHGGSGTALGTKMHLGFGGLRVEAAFGRRNHAKFGK